MLVKRSNPFQLISLKIKYRLPIDDEFLRYNGEIYHPFHFICKSCGCELNAKGREMKDELYCFQCHENMDIPVCSACHTAIDKERIVYALGKQWHVEVSIRIQDTNFNFAVF